MKKLLGFVLLMSAANFINAQYLIIGKDSISLEQFKKDYLYGLENSGIEKTIASAEDFHLLQQFASDKKIDTTADFRMKMRDREYELRGKFFFPKEIIDPVLNSYMKDLQNEKQVQVFIATKAEGDTQNYQQIYNDVIAGKITMEEAITKYSKPTSKAEPFYVKPGGIDNTLYAEIKNLPNNSYTKFISTPRYYSFAKVLDSRPTLGYLVFGTISYPKNDEAESMKTKIYNELKSGKPFQEVAKLYGVNEHEKNNGGIVIGSPTLPNEVYQLFKGKSKAYYTPEPLLFGDNYFIFNIYNVEPYQLTDKNRDFYIREMNSSLYAEMLQDKMLNYLKSDTTYKEFPEFQAVKKSYQQLNVVKDNTVLFRYKNHQTTAADIKKTIGDKKSEAEKLPSEIWSEAIAGVNSQDLMKFYSEDFTQQKNIKNELNEHKKILYSDYIFSKYLNEEITKHPEWLTDYYNKNKSKYMLGNRADGRVAIIADEKLTKEISSEIKDPAKWESLKTKYYGKLNDKKQILVNFEKGEMAEEADIFTKQQVPFKTGVHQIKMGERFLVIAIDKILPPSQMTFDEAQESVKEAVTDQKLKETIEQQKAKTNIVVQPGFLKDLEKNFKK